MGGSIKHAYGVVNKRIQNVQHSNRETTLTDYTTMENTTNTNYETTTTVTADKRIHREQASPPNNSTHATETPTYHELPQPDKRGSVEVGTKTRRLKGEGM